MFLCKEDDRNVADHGSAGDGYLENNAVDRFKLFRRYDGDVTGHLGLIVRIGLVNKE